MKQLRRGGAERGRRNRLKRPSPDARHEKLGGSVLPQCVLWELHPFKTSIFFGFQAARRAVIEQWGQPFNFLWGKHLSRDELAAIMAGRVCI